MGFTKTYDEIKGQSGGWLEMSITPVGTSCDQCHKLIDGNSRAWAWKFNIGMIYMHLHCLIVWTGKSLRADVERAEVFLGASEPFKRGDSEQVARLAEQRKMVEKLLKDCEALEQAERNAAS
jgi:hypothetical protein